MKRGEKQGKEREPSNSKFGDVAKIITLPRLDRPFIVDFVPRRSPPRLSLWQAQVETNSKIESKSTITGEFGWEACRLAEEADAISLPLRTKSAGSHAKVCLAFPYLELLTVRHGQARAVDKPASPCYTDR